MTDTALALMACLLAKHFLFDFVLQTPYQLLNKGVYGHPGGLLHAGLHAAATLATLAGFGVAIGTAATVAAVESVVHYHIDWIKEAVTKRFVSGQGAAYWSAIGFDQLLHNLTYAAMVWAVRPL